MKSLLVFKVSGAYSYHTNIKS